MGWWARIFRFAIAAYINLFTKTEVKYLVYQRSNDQLNVALFSNVVD